MLNIDILIEFSTKPPYYLFLRLSSYYHMITSQLTFFSYVMQTNQWTYLIAKLHEI